LVLPTDSYPTKATTNANSILIGIFSPLIPFKAAFFIAIFIRLYRHAPFPTKGTTCFTAFGWALSQSEHPVIGVVRLFGDGKNFTNEVCGLAECKGLWFEWVFILIVGITSWRGWKLTGLTDRIVEGIVSDLWGDDKPIIEHMERVVVVDEKTVMIGKVPVDEKVDLATEKVEKENQ
jgi:hypothetical protein